MPCAVQSELFISSLYTNFRKLKWTKLVLQSSNAAVFFCCCWVFLYRYLYWSKDLKTGIRDDTRNFCANLDSENWKKKKEIIKLFLKKNKKQTNPEENKTKHRSIAFYCYITSTAGKKEHFLFCLLIFFFAVKRLMGYCCHPARAPKFS